MPCPWYRHGVCTSPRLSEPSDAVVSVDRCSSEAGYRGCAYFIEPTGIVKKSSSRRDRGKIYAPIHAITEKIEIGCPEAEVIDTDNGFRVAYCKILGRYLTKHEAALCSKQWRECPYRMSTVM